jgi:hypothetical protein
MHAHGQALSVLKGVMAIGEKAIDDFMQQAVKANQ